MRGTSAFKYITRRGSRTKPPRRLGLSTRISYGLYLGNYSVGKEKFGHSPGKRLTRQGIEPCHRPRLAPCVRACVRAPLGSTSDERAPGNVANGNGARGSRGERLEFLLRNNLFYEPRYPTRFVSSRVGYGIDRPLLRLRPSQPSPARSKCLFAAAEHGRTAHLGFDSIRFTLEIPPSSPLSTAHGSPRPFVNAAPPIQTSNLRSSARSRSLAITA